MAKLSDSTVNDSNILSPISNSLAERSSIAFAHLPRGKKSKELRLKSPKEIRKGVIKGVIKVDDMGVETGLC